jgi:DNA polymerase-3 subunit gamma/tau
VASQALYRKWRSQRFSDLVGQEPVARTLRNAVRTNRIAHAYLFCGPRGVGKTSAARILAKAVNCPNAVDGEPCAECEMCRAIQDGGAIDVLEIDAASNRGIDEIRGIREKVGLAPAVARYKFYILDEAHMLTVDAFNALLKTLEEPPANTVFVLVTTEVQRLPETVLSRCQRLDFRRIGVAAAVERLAFVCQEEDITPEAGVLELLARSAAGSLRDAEGMLDQIVAYAGSAPSLAAARSVLGVAGPEAARDLLIKLTDNRVEDAIRSVNHLVDQGADPRQTALDVVGCLRSLLLLRTSDALADLIDEGPEAMSELRRLAQRLTASQIVELIRLFTPGLTSRSALRPQLPLEISVVEAARVLGEPAASPPAPIAPPSPRPPEPVPVRSVREAVEPARSASRPPPTPPGESDRAPTALRSRAPESAPAGTSTGNAGILWSDVLRRWNEVLDACGTINRTVQAFLRSGRPVAGDGDSIVLGFPYEFHRERIEDQKNRLVVEDAIARVHGSRVRVRCTLVTREALLTTDPFQAAMEDPLVKAAVSMGARVRSVMTEEGSEEK